MPTIALLAAAMTSLLVRYWPADLAGPTQERDEQVLWLVAAALAFLAG